MIGLPLQYVTVLKAFPDAHAERGAVIAAEERDSRLDTPIFVCQLSFPGIPTFLHFFEPRYAMFISIDAETSSWHPTGIA